MDRELFTKYIHSTSLEEIDELVVKLFHREDIPPEWKKLSKDIWNQQKKTRTTDDKIKKIILNEIHHKINIMNQEQSLDSSQRIIHLIRMMSKIAAIFFIPLLILFVLNFRHTTELKKYLSNRNLFEVNTPIGSTSTLTLPDSTVIYLNYKSRIKYPPVFDGKTREVILEGEGFFKIAHNPEKPFIVKIHDIDIKAVGTEFNVKAYTNEDIIETTLLNGKVIIEKRTKDQNLYTLKTLNPGQKIIYNKITNEISCHAIDPEKYIAWKQGTIVFDDESLLSITKRLERMYPVEFEFKEEYIKYYTYNSVVVNPSLYRILKLTKMSTPIDYKTLKQTKTSEGKSEKQKIIIYSTK